MFKVTYSSGEVIADSVKTEDEAWKRARKWVTQHLKTSEGGPRLLKQMGGAVSDAFLQSKVTVAPYIGVWTESDGGQTIPERLAPICHNDDWLVFEVGDGSRFIGAYDDEQGSFVSGSRSFSPERVVKYFILPDSE